MNASRDKLLSLTLFDDQLFAQGSNGILTCLDAETGRQLWAVHLGGSDEPTFTPTVNEEQVLVISGSRLIALNKRTGDIIWRLQMPASPSTSPVTDDAGVYIGMQDGSVMVFNLKKIQELNDHGLIPQWSYITVRWKYATGKPLAVPANVDKDIVTFGSLSGMVYTVNKIDRRLKYTFDAEFPITAGLASYQNLVLVPSGDFRLYGLNQENGRIRWQFVTSSQILRTPRVVDNEIFVCPDRGGMYKLKAASGLETWWNPLIEDFVSASPTRVYTTDRQQNLVVLNRKDGATLGSIPLNRFSVRMANELTDRIFVGTQSGLVMCLRERDRDEPPSPSH